MRRRFRVRLSRRVGKKIRSVDVLVYQVTLGGFIEALRVAGESVIRYRDQVLKGKDLTDRDVVMALAHPVVCAGIVTRFVPGAVSLGNRA